jgi:hypothetical protein
MMCIQERDSHGFGLIRVQIHHDGRVVIDADLNINRNDSQAHKDAFTS